MAIARRRHDVIPVSISDRRERLLPSVGLIELEDEESGTRLVVDSSSRRVRDAFAARATQRVAQFEGAVRRLKIEPLMLETGVDYVEPITAYFRKREARRSR